MLTYVHSREDDMLNLRVILVIVMIEDLETQNEIQVIYPQLIPLPMCQSILITDCLTLKLKDQPNFVINQKLEFDKSRLFSMRFTWDTA